MCGPFLSVTGIYIPMRNVSCLSGKLKGHHIEFFDLAPGVAVDKYSPLHGPSSELFLYLHFHRHVTPSSRIQQFCLRFGVSCFMLSIIVQE